MRKIALETFKIIHKKSPMFLQDLLTIKNNVYDFKYINTADIPRPRTTKYGKNSFRYEAARLWNTLPSEVRNRYSFDQFIYHSSDWCGGEKCFCSSSSCAVSCLNSLLLYHIFYLHNLCLFTFYMI